MLHNLALATSAQTPTFTKDAAPVSTPEKVGALTTGINLYLSSNKAPQPAVHYKQGMNYSPNAAMPPKPPAMPTVPTPGPGVGGVPKIKPPSFGPPSLKPPKSPSSSVSGPSNKGMGGPPKTAEDVVAPAAGAALGGLGGWHLGDKVIAPMLENKAQKLIQEIASKNKILENINKAKRLAPTGAAIAGALLLAALAAIKARQDEREQLIQFGGQPYDRTGGGFAPQERTQFGSTHPEMFYG